MTKQNESSTKTSPQGPESVSSKATEQEDTSKKSNVPESRTKINASLTDVLMKYVSAAVAETLNDLHLVEPLGSIPREELAGIRSQASSIMKNKVFVTEINRVMHQIRDDLAMKEYSAEERRFLQGQIYGLRRFLEHLASLASHS